MLWIRRGLSLLLIVLSLSVSPSIPDVLATERSFIYIHSPAEF